MRSHNFQSGDTSRHSPLTHNPYPLLRCATTPRNTGFLSRHLTHSLHRKFPFVVPTRYFFLLFLCRTISLVVRMGAATGAFTIHPSGYIHHTHVPGVVIGRWCFQPAYLRVFLVRVASSVCTNEAATGNRDAAIVRGSCGKFISLPRSRTSRRLFTLAKFLSFRSSGAYLLDCCELSNFIG